jgi:hypothetical protein
MEMPGEFLTSISPLYGGAIADNVQVAVLKVYDSFPGSRRNICVSNVPLQRNSPIKYLRTTCYFANVERDMLLKVPKSLTYAFSGNTAANWVKQPHEVVEGLPLRSPSERALYVH